MLFPTFRTRGQSLRPAASHSCRKTPLRSRCAAFVGDSPVAMSRAADRTLRIRNAARRLPFLSAIFLLAVGSLAAGEIAPAGARLAERLDSLHVEQHWQAGQRIDWRSGDIDPRGPVSSTHCSAFVAAACDRLGIYILRPPEHHQELLANAQNDWLKAAGPRLGWSPVDTPRQAQRLANQGSLVVASFRNPDHHKPGHIVIVRPSAKSDEAIDEAGPQIIQAGTHNDRSTTLRRGFTHHRGAFLHHEIDFFAHATAVGE
jgi:hypothetical protein